MDIVHHGPHNDFGRRKIVPARHTVHKSINPHSKADGRVGDSVTKLQQQTLLDRLISPLEIFKVYQVLDDGGFVGRRFVGGVVLQVRRILHSEPEVRLGRYYRFRMVAGEEAQDDATLVAALDDETRVVKLANHKGVKGFCSDRGTEAGDCRRGREAETGDAGGYDVEYGGRGVERGEEAIEDMIP